MESWDKQTPHCQWGGVFVFVGKENIADLGLAEELEDLVFLGIFYFCFKFDNFLFLYYCF